MHKILQDLHSVLENGHAVVKDYESKRDALHHAVEDVNKQKDLNKEKELDLSYREAEVLKVENASNLMKEAQSLMAEAQRRMTDLKVKEDEFKHKMDVDNQLLDSKRQDIAKEAEGVERGRLSIEEEVKRRVDVIVSKIKQ